MSLGASRTSTGAFQLYGPSCRIATKCPKTRVWLVYSSRIADEGGKRLFSSTRTLLEIRDINELPTRLKPRYQETPEHDLLSLQWPSPPRNILLTMKDDSSSVLESFKEYATHIKSTYPSTSIILEPSVAERIHESFTFPIFTLANGRQGTVSKLHDRVDLISTLGGDGTILRASSLFAGANNVPPVLSFSMGTLGFLGEWKFKEYKKAFREVYMSGAGHSLDGNEQAKVESTETDDSSGVSPSTISLRSSPAGWSSIRGKFMGSNRAARVLLRNRLKVSIFDQNGERVSGESIVRSEQDNVYAMNEVIIHRGRNPHLAVVEVFVGGRYLTEAVADGMIISTPTGSTAYSLSSGGSIVHPLVSSLLLTPICPRSLSFRPLVLPANTPITLRLSNKNRGREVEISVDGVRKSEGLTVGMEIRVSGEEVMDEGGSWIGGVPSIVRSTARHEPGGEDSWVGGLNGLLKFNYPFGEEH